VVVQIKLRHAVIVRDKQIRVAGPLQIGCGAGQRPPAAGDPRLGADLFEPAVAHIVKEIFAAAVLRILEALGHHARVGQLPQVHILRIISADEEIQLPVVVIVKPHGGVGIDP